MRTLHFLIVIIAPLIPSLARAVTWADEPAAYLSSPTGRDATIGRSHGPCLSAAEAESQAIDDAARQLIYPRFSTTPGPDREVMARVLRDSVVNGRLVRDRSITVVHKPYGDIWSAAVLVDMPPARVSQEMTRWGTQRDVERRRRVAGTVGIMIVVGLAYLVANGVTRGYFRGHLRCCALAACLIPVLLIWMAR